MEKRLFIITNPTHFLNVKNYVENNAKAENFIFLITRPFKGEKDFIQMISDDPEFNYLGVIATKARTGILNYLSLFQNLIKLKLIAKSHPFFNKIFFTNYKSYSQHLIRGQFQTTQTILLSDGAGILLIAEERKSSKEIPFKGVPFRGNKYALKKILGIVPLDKLHFYSAVSIEVAKGDTLEIFKYKASSNASINLNRIFIIGSPIVENGFIGLNKYIEYLQKMKQSFPDCDFTYFAHRREWEANLIKYTFLGEILRNEMPFEQLLETEKILPAKILSILSSVLLNLYPVYPQINFYYLELESDDIDLDLKFKDNYLILKRKFDEIESPNFNRLRIN